MTLEQIKDALQDRVLISVAVSARLHINTVRAIASGRNTNPSHKTLEALRDYFKARP